jgi:hypothetical protein
MERSPEQIQIPTFEMSEKPQKLCALLRAGKMGEGLKKTQSQGILPMMQRP